MEGVEGGGPADGIGEAGQGDGGIPVAVDGAGDGGERRVAGEKIGKGGAGALRLRGGGGARGEREVGEIRGLA